jgi:uncharacterized protein YcnI
MRKAIPAAIAALALAAPTAAGAHVTLQPDSAPEGGFTRLDVRVPDERDDKGTIKVAVKLPPGFVSASYEPVPGWTTRITKQKLTKPIKVEGLDVDEQIAQITWTGDPAKGGVIEPGQFQDFGLSVAIPRGRPGAKLTFKALQTYQGGEVVRWIGPPDADEPAPTVTLTSGDVGSRTQPTGPTPAATPAKTDSRGGGNDGLAIAALIVGALGLLAGVAGLLAVRRARTPRAPGPRDRLRPVLEFLLTLAPLALLVVSLLAGRFVGEQRILRRLRGLMPVRRARPARRRAPLHAALRSLLERGAITARGPPSGLAVIES